MFLIVVGYQLYHDYTAKNHFKADFISYLESKGYHYTTDIEAIDVVCFSQKCDVYAAIVNFKDEPSVDYIYSTTWDLK